MHHLPMLKVSRVLSLSLIFAFAVSLVACGPRAVRGDDVEGLDSEAMGTGLDKVDLQRLLSDNMNAMESSPVVKRWEAEDQPQIAVLPFRNETSEHIDSALDALISDVETALINAGHVSVVSLESQGMLIEEIRKQQGAEYDQGKSAAIGRQMGVKYIVTGKVFSTDEKMKGERRVQYYLFMQVLEVETGRILFQNKASLTKALI